ncbi:hypothetical protein [Longimicrobium terrae]|uniref:DUF2489 domain-containing protein n=1 Tax=Longimicrobium terrae TaxID=1639882 RepID=A0A841GVQ4_9BACT|nr:hypothetical protein [Longimicrobium terrae]MBB4635484.1 hypothetical protein [Longimicrobium terrae]MBB6069878.1 hypothetical protein [Longimicrobium terrae]NNC32793.1 hypothetical protein [Longimicrobium terrae]
MDRNEPEARRLRDEMVTLARKILRGETGVLPGSAAMMQYRWGAGLHEMDEDLLVFLGIDSQEDHLPSGSARRYWNPDALARADAQIAEAEAFYREVAFAACESLIRRFRTD